MTSSSDIAAKHRALVASVCRSSFAHFAKRFWPIVTGTVLVPNHATQAVTATLQAVGDGVLWRVLIAMPPGVGKSSLLALYSAWRLARDATWRSLHAMHSARLAETESRKVRRVVESEAFRELFPYVVLRSDENRTDHWATTRNGRYHAVGFDGGITSIRANEAVIDDPLDAHDRFSKAARNAVWETFTGSLIGRLDDERPPIIVVHQRLDRDDLIGRLIDAGGWTLLELAAEFEPERRCSIANVWTDPRAEEGELLAPTILSREKLDALKGGDGREGIGLVAYATQYLQRPTSDDGAVWKRSWWRFYAQPGVPLDTRRPAGCDLETPAVLMPEHFSRVVISADFTAGSVKASADFNAVQVWGQSAAGRYLLAHWWARAGFEEALARSRELVQRYPLAKFVIEHAANGRPIVEKLTKDLPGIVPITAKGSKASRWAAVSPTVESRSCYLPLGMPDLPKLVEEFAGASRHDDALDAAALALHELAGAHRDQSQTIVGGFAFVDGSWSSGESTSNKGEAIIPLGFLIGGGS